MVKALLPYPPHLIAQKGVPRFPRLMIDDNDDSPNNGQRGEPMDLPASPAHYVSQLVRRKMTSEGDCGGLGLRERSYPSIAHARGQSLPNATKCRWVAPDRAWRVVWTIESAAWEGGEISVVICTSLTGRFLFDNKLLELALCKPHPLGVVGVREGKRAAL